MIAVARPTSKVCQGEPKASMEKGGQVRMV